MGGLRRQEVRRDRQPVRLQGVAIPGATSSHSRAAGIIGAAIAAGAVAAAWGTLVERRMFTLRRVTAPVLERGSEPIRVLHLSDMHMAPWQRDKQEWVASLAELRPDLVVDTGDNLGHADGLVGVRAALDAFRGVPGVFVNGSNDYFAPTFKNPLRYFLGPSKRDRNPARLDTDELLEYFDSLGWLDLNNRAAALTVRGTGLELFGVNDPHRGYDRLESIPGELEALRGDESYATDDRIASDAPAHTLTIGVTHAPYRRVLASFVSHGAGIVFAGHTHGGQVCIPGFGALVTNCDIPRAQVKGLSTWRNGLRSAYLHVSAGIGTSIYAPVRFACPPEATLVTLTERL